MEKHKSDIETVEDIKRFLSDGWRYGEVAVESSPDFPKRAIKGWLLKNDRKKVFYIFTELSLIEVTKFLSIKEDTYRNGKA